MDFDHPRPCTRFAENLKNRLGSQTEANILKTYHVAQSNSNKEPNENLFNFHFTADEKLESFKRFI